MGGKGEAGYKCYEMGKGVTGRGLQLGRREGGSTEREEQGTPNTKMSKKASRNCITLYLPKIIHGS